VTLTFVDGDAVGEGVCEGGLGVAECHACLDAGTRQGHTTPARLLLRTCSEERLESPTHIYIYIYKYIEICMYYICDMSLEKGLTGHT
jgi:hypothetical protein